MMKRVLGIGIVAVVLAGCGGDASRGGAASSEQSVDSGPAPTPALDSVGGTTPDQGRQD